MTFTPALNYAADNSEYSLATLGLKAQAIFNGQTEDVLTALVAAGSSGGARPKAQLYFNSSNPKYCRTVPQAEDDAWLVKFTSENFMLGHEEGLCEAVYLQLAESLLLQPPEWQLLAAPPNSGASHWLALKRFDYIKNTQGKDARLHLHSICGLLDADFRMQSLDYLDLIKASRQMCKSPQAGQLQFQRAMFNLFACNQDDHSKNWAFLQNDQGQWQPAPFYGITFNPHPFDEHTTAFLGHGKQPPLKVIQTLSENAGYASWQLAREIFVK